MQEILKAFGNLSDGLESRLTQIYLNCFILEADEKTIRLWETLLRITYTNDLSLEQRRRVIIGRLCGNNHIGDPEIKSIISNYSDKAVHIDFSDGVIFIKVDGEIFDETNLLDTLSRRIPAHLKLDIKINIARKFKQNLYLAYQSTLKSSVAGERADPKLSYIDRSGISGGGLCYTHIKSKLIKED